MNEQACQRPGCEGRYEDVGGGELYCDTCGLAPVVAPDGALGSPPTGVTVSGGRGASGGTAATHGAGPPGSRGTGAGSGASYGSGSGTGYGSGAAYGAGAAYGSGAVASYGSGGPVSYGSAPSTRASNSSRSSRRSVSGRLSGSSTARQVSARSTGSASSGSARGRLGAGLVSVPTVPRHDPRAAVLERAEVPERKRFCSRADCGAPVGRARGERPGRTEGFCTKCGHPYSFVPKLGPGTVVHGQYEVVGCLAHGGLGWVYLAIDRAVSDRWVVLKGLLDTGDQDAMEAAISERRFLAEIEHATIVRIYNFVEHLDPRTGSLDGYIVMEYVGGKSLKEIANARRTADGRRDPLPVEQACAFGIEALDALGHLHSRSLLYCDFKVDNAIQTEDRLKLIDMGAVRRADDEESAIYGTVGYQAPEVAELGPSVASDLYTVARTLAVLTFDFQGYTTVYADSLPDPAEVPVFQEFESFYRLLVRATDPDPARRFASAEEMAEQLTGVLREIVARRTGRPHPALSTHFGPELRVPDTELFLPAGGAVSALGVRDTGGGSGAGGKGWGRRRARTTPAGQAAGAAPRATTGPAPAGFGPPPGLPAQATLPAQAAPPARPGLPSSPGTAPLPAPPAAPPVSPATALRPLRLPEAALALPVPRVDASDPSAGFLAGLHTAVHGELISALRDAPADSPEVRLREVRARLEMGQPDAAGRSLDDLERAFPEDWRVVWYRGLASLVTGELDRAALSFDAVYDAFPGEAAPKLALALCAEALGQLDNAVEYYRLVWQTDPGYVSAAFGLARVLFAAGERASSVRALETVPESSVHHAAAGIAATRARLRGRAPGQTPLADLRAAAARLGELGDAVDAVRAQGLAAEVLGAALDWVLSGRHGAGPQEGGLLGCPLDERGLRFGLERAFRTLARLAGDGGERIELVERANRLRPRTWV
ncbi:serine/threonine-protein kinase [Streptomyces sp. NRRL F-5630]|uniref:serine/threonine-protein kinase n=1 Tax=Streptomyces sp. NRRL F-5630 TaxID=1463864 RepID=UPI0004CA2402|nr:serine/threonine-protein kinase [Streptomyces sp. NRRL F-5630]